MARLPITGGDDGTWGAILNEFLGVEHNADGTLKSSGSLASKVSINTLVYNVKDFGALGDNSTDDTAAIQAAITASVAGSIIFFPHGVYLISAPLQLAMGRTYQGSHWNLGRTVIKQKAGSNITAAAGGALLVDAGWTNNQTYSSDPIHLLQLDINCNVANNPSSSCHGVLKMCYFSTDRNVTISQTGNGGCGLVYTDTYKSGGQITNTAVENRTEFCKFTAISGDGYRVINQSGTGKITDGYILYCLFESMGGMMINLQRAAGFFVTGNHGYAIGTNGISLANAFSTICSDNEIEDFGGAQTPNAFFQGISVVALDGRGATVTNNRVYCVEASGNNCTYQYISLSAAFGATTADILCSHNQMRGSGTVKGLGIVAQTAGGGAQLQLCIPENNQVNNINTPYFIDANVSINAPRSFKKIIRPAFDSDIALQLRASSSTMTASLLEAQDLNATWLYKLDSHGRPTVPNANYGTILTVQAAAGVGATVTTDVVQDIAGRFTLTTGTGPTSGDQVVVTFANTMTNNCSVILQATSASSFAAGPYISSNTSAGFTIAFANAPSASTAHRMHYHVIGM